MSSNTKSELTKLALCDALKSLLAAKNIDQITVGEITDAAGFNRQTFYYHFRDVYDLLTWIFNQEMSAIRPYLDKPDLNWRETLSRIILGVSQRKYLCSCIVHGVGRDQLVFALHDSIYELIKYVIEHEANIRPVPPEHLNFTVEFYTYAIGHSIYEWIAGGMREAPEELFEHLCFVISSRQNADPPRLDGADA